MDAYKYPLGYGVEYVLTDEHFPGRRIKDRGVIIVQLRVTGREGCYYIVDSAGKITVMAESAITGYYPDPLNDEMKEAV